MSSRSFISLMGVALVLGSAAMAHAESGKKATDFTVRADASAVAADGSQSLKWDARRGRWGVTLNLNSPAERNAAWGDVQAGAYFRLTPALRIGGAVALGDQPTLPVYRKIEPRDSAPRVRLETAFKF